MNKCAIYCRVSTDEQVKYGYSISTQDEILTEYAKQNKLTVIDRYLDGGYSGSTIKRPELQRLLKDVKNKRIDMIIFTRLDRWFRSVSQYYKIQDVLEANDVYWQATEEDYETKTAAGRFKVNIMLSVSQQYRDTQSEKIVESLNVKVKNGYYISGSVPFGYKLEKVAGGSKLVIDENNRTKALEIIEMYEKTNSLRKTVLLYNEYKGGRANVANLSAYLKNTILYGEYKGFVDFCEPLITKDRFDRIQELLTCNINYKQKRVYLFSGLLKCSKCGASLGGMIKNKKYKAYRCCAFVSNKCSNVTVYYEKSIEKTFLNEIEKDLQDYVFNIKLQNTNTTDNTKEIKKIDEKIKRLNNIYILGNITDEDYASQALELKNQKETLLQVVSTKDTKEIEYLSTNFRTIYDSLSLEEKRILIRSIVKTIDVYSKDNIRINFK